MCVSPYQKTNKQVSPQNEEKIFLKTNPAPQMSRKKVIHPSNVIIIALNLAWFVEIASDESDTSRAGA